MPVMPWPAGFPPLLCQGFFLANVCRTTGKGATTAHGAHNLFAAAALIATKLLKEGEQRLLSCVVMESF